MPRIFGLDVNPSGDVLYGPFTLLDNTVIPVTVQSWPAAANRYIQMQYSITRNSENETGILYITNDGTNASLAGDAADIIDLGIDLNVSISAGNVILQYTSTSIGFDAVLKFYQKNWT